MIGGLVVSNAVGDRVKHARPRRTSCASKSRVCTTSLPIYTMDLRRCSGPLCLLAIFVIVTVADTRYLRVPNSGLSFPLAACLPAFRDELPPPYRRICAAIEATPQRDLANLFKATTEQENNNGKVT